MTSRLAATADTHRGLLPIAGRLFRQAVDLCAISSAFHLPLAVLRRQSDRLTALELLLHTLESDAGLRFAEAGFPYVSNTRRWGPDVPGAGRTTGGPGDPRPSEVLFTVKTCLVAEAVDEYPFTRAERAVDDAISASREPVAAAMAFVRSGQITPAAAGWALRYQRDGATIGARLLEMTFSAFDDVRHATSFDDWFFAYVDLLNGCGMTRKYHDDRRLPLLPLGVRAALSQLEEIEADGFVLVNQLSDVMADGRVTPGAVLTRFGDYLRVIAAMDHHGRGVEQRAGPPLAVSGVPLTGPAVPEAWGRFSPRLAPVLVPLWGHGIHGATPTGHEKVGLVKATAVAAQRWSRVRLHSRALATVGTALRHYPWSTPLMLEKAIVLDRSGQHDAALATLTDAIAIEPQNPLLWHSLTVVLRQCGAPDEADLAWRMTRLVEHLDETAGRATAR